MRIPGILNSATFMLGGYQIGSAVDRIGFGKFTYPLNFSFNKAQGVMLSPVIYPA